MPPWQAPRRLESCRNGSREKRAEHQAEIHHAAAFRKQRAEATANKAKPSPALEALLKGKQAAVPFKADTAWHELTLVTEGDELRCSLDGQVIARHRSAGFAHPTKRWFSFLIGATVWVDDVKIYKVK